MAFQEMLVQRDINKDGIAAVQSIETKLLRSTNFRDFRPTRPVEVSRVYPCKISILPVLAVYEMVVDDLLKFSISKQQHHGCCGWHFPDKKYGVSGFLWIVKF